MSRQPVTARQWLGVVATFLVLALPFSFAIFSLTTFYDSFAIAFHWSRTNAVTGNSIILLLIGVLSPFIGKAVDALSAKTVILAGCLLTSLGFALLSTLKGSLAEYYLYCALLGLSGCASSILANSILIGPWFERSRGLMVGIINGGIGVGGFMAPRLIAKLLPATRSESVLASGISHAFLVLAGLMLIPFVTTLLVVTNETRKRTAGLNVKVPTTGELLRMPMFWAFGVSLFCAAHAMVGVQNPMVLYFISEGLTRPSGAAILSIALGSAFFGKVISGILADKISARAAVIFSIVCVFLGILGLLATPAHSAAIDWVAVVFGLGYGGIFNAVPVIVFENFGTHKVGSSLGWLYVFFGLGTATGPELAAQIVDTTHSWSVAHAVDLAIVAVALLLALATGRLTRRRSEISSKAVLSASS
ncbi:MAG TPA: MFS transporter [Bryobacteraceae bacterium]|nr:MFS transporter [Bryobacteraceae bacterium]